MTEKSAVDIVLDRYKKLYKPQYLPRHRHAVVVFGIKRYTELAEHALKVGKQPGRLMSKLLTNEWEKFRNREKLQALKSQLS
jgi:chemotaxis methyl-accepting protein methylase